MYVYPSGLKCNVSATRVRIFESFVPPIGIFAALVSAAPSGMAADWIASRAPDGFGPPLGLLAFGVSWVALAAVCVAIVFGVFQVWCRPVDEDGVGRRTRKGLFLREPKVRL